MCQKLQLLDQKFTHSISNESSTCRSKVVKIKKNFSKKKKKNSSSIFPHKFPTMVRGGE